MNSISIKTFCIPFSFFLAILSCSKSDDTNNKGSVVGTWNFSEIGIDKNSNDIIDSGETKTVAEIGAYGSWTFRSDNTYSSAIFDGANPYDESGTYPFSNGIIKTTTGGGTFNDYRVFTITNNRLVVKHSSDPPGHWIILTK